MRAPPEAYGLLTANIKLYSTMPSPVIYLDEPEPYRLGGGKNFEIGRFEIFSTCSCYVTYKQFKCIKTGLLDCQICSG
jgi:hypothetical protein